MLDLEAELTQANADLSTTSQSYRYAGQFSNMWQIVILTAVLIHIPSIRVGQHVSAAATSSFEASQLRDEVRKMFYHSFNGYMEHAFPFDELRPLSCTGEDSLGGYSLTLVDALDTLALLGDRQRFSEAVTWLGQNLRFDKGLKVESYNDELLHLAEDLGYRLLPAFDTPTGIPYGSVNLLFGVNDNESQVTSTAGGGTLTLEFGVLSRLTRNPVFERVSRNAVRGLWAQRSNLGLVGAHINIFTGEWTHKDSGIGTSVDSFYEYLLKAYIVLGDEEYLYIFNEAYKAVMRLLFHDPWYLEVNMNSAVVVWPLFNSLQAFWPGLQVLSGDIEPAIRTHMAFFSVWKKFGFTPEGFNLATLTVQPGQKSYPLRPELIESTYMLYKATKNPMYLHVGQEILRSIQKSARCPCGYCHIADVETHEQDDHMESFFLAETLKYLWLLFDLAAGGKNMIEKGPYMYVFTTEGHMLPLTPEIAFPAENCSFDGSTLKGTFEDSFFGEKGEMTCLGDLNIQDHEGDDSGNKVQGLCSSDESVHSTEAVSGYSPIKGVCPKPTFWKQLGVNLSFQRGLSRRSKAMRKRKTHKKVNTKLPSTISKLLQDHFSVLDVQVDVNSLSDTLFKHKELAQKGGLRFIQVKMNGGDYADNAKGSRSDITILDKARHDTSERGQAVKELEENHNIDEENGSLSVGANT
ncbi:hypothetical protein O6H91_04G031400 [Diphasiastrum complanatum]|uniref:Uncharacterized protein n=1 Tax=Diphasiastrum complanatum TaxID=34168 RepID=A0ACC2DVC5_DIPCM|nr:hypothetical protein O6H91_04G031400 [Diphasiastrum complanatum]